MKHCQAAKMKPIRYFAVLLFMGGLLLVFALRDMLLSSITGPQRVIITNQNPILTGQNFRAVQVPTPPSKKIDSKIDRKIDSKRTTKKNTSPSKEFQKQQVASLNDIFGALVRVHDYVPSVPVGSAPPKIPHIIHQTWDNDQVPVMFSSYITSWTKQHPDWEYWFWTPREVNQLLATHYPQYSQMYANYSEAIFKANLMRYFIMHKYGGVYADLDLECLRPLDGWTMDNECVMSQNHYVHAYIVGDRDVSEVMITFLASRPGHPYFKLAIEMLPSYKDMEYNKKLVYAQTVYKEYIQRAESKAPENRVTVTHPDYFLPTYDKAWYGKVQKTCDKRNKRTAMQDMVCEELKDGTNGRKPKSFSYANHYWVHVIMWGKNKAKKATINITDIVPKAVFPFTSVKL